MMMVVHFLLHDHHDTVKIISVLNSLSELRLCPGASMWRHVRPQQSMVINENPSDSNVFHGLHWIVMDPDGSAWMPLATH